MDKEIILIIVNGAIAIAGFMMALFISRLTKSIDKLASEDAVLHERINNQKETMHQHREDVLKNYIRSDQLDGVKKDVIGRMDRLEGAFKDALAAHEHRERESVMHLIAKLKSPD